MEPVELLTLQAVRERLEAGRGVVTVTRGTFSRPVAHMVACQWLANADPAGRHTRLFWTPHVRGRAADARRTAVPPLPVAARLTSPRRTLDTGRAMSQENIDVVKQVLAAFSRYDFDGALEHFHPDAVLEMADEDPLYERYIGREEVKKVLDVAVSILGGMEGRARGDSKSGG